MTQETVLIVSDEAGAGPAQALVERWNAETAPPMFVQVRAELWNGGTPPRFCVAVVLGLSEARASHALAILTAAGKPVICLDDDLSPALHRLYPRVTFLPKSEAWTEVLVRYAQEVFRRLRATSRAQEAERVSSALQTEATLGRYMQEVRHGLNNALTSVLGNSELLLLDAASLAPRTRDQVETIHNMALRMHQVMQRLTSLETELRVAAKPSHSETAPPPAASSAPAVPQISGD